MRSTALAAATVIGVAAALTVTAQASTVSEREYKRGYNDCLRGDYDQYQHGASYKRGCRAAEKSGKSTGESVRGKADANAMRAICHGAVVGRFHHMVANVKIDKVEHQRGN
jgi:hypothetical protein